MRALNPWGRWLGIEGGSVSPSERMAAALGGFLGIGMTLVVSSFLLDLQGAAWVVASMGASAVLLFAVPHGALSQPWNLIGGHLLSALIGVSCARWIPQPHLAAALAVGGAIGVMHLSRSIHPPGGATALAAVVGGEGIRALGYGYVLAPVLVNLLVLLAVAVGFNYLFPWRRYPAELMRRGRQARPGAPPPIEHEDLVYALSQIDSFVDVTEEDLLRIYELATGHSSRTGVKPEALRVGGCYSNGLHGAAWAVRRIERISGEGDQARVTYRVVAGAEHPDRGALSREAFSQWAAFPVVLKGDTWQRLVVR